jgi:hypothetical protein
MMACFHTFAADFSFDHRLQYQLCRSSYVESVHMRIIGCTDCAQLNLQDVRRTNSLHQKPGVQGLAKSEGLTDPAECPKFSKWNPFSCKLSPPETAQFFVIQ